MTIHSTRRALAAFLVLVLRIPIAAAEPTPGLPETAIQTFVDPCANSPITALRPPDFHADGVTFRFDGATAEYSALFDLYYEVTSTSVYTCQKNSNTGALSSNPALFYDAAWGRVGSNVDSLIAGAAAHLDSLFDRGVDACYACFVARPSGAGGIRKGCFPRGVRVALDADGATAAVEDIAVGDELWNPLLQKTAQVLAIVESPEKNALIEFGIDGSVLRATDGHPVLTKQGMKQAKDLSLGDYVYDGQGSLHAITSVRVLPQRDGETVINFILEAETNSPDERLILADGIVTGDMTIQGALAGVLSGSR